MYTQISYPSNIYYILFSRFYSAIYYAFGNHDVHPRVLPHIVGYQPWDLLTMYAKEVLRTFKVRFDKLVRGGTLGRHPIDALQFCR